MSALRRLEAAAVAATRAAALACQGGVGRGGGPDCRRRGGHRGDAPIGFTARREAGPSSSARAPRTRRRSLRGRAGRRGWERAGLRHRGGPARVHEALRPRPAGLPGDDRLRRGAGSMASMGPAFWMDKLVGPPGTRGARSISPTRPRRTRWTGSARRSTRPSATCVVVVLDKPRHAELIRRLRRAGALGWPRRRRRGRWAPPCCPGAGRTC